MNFPGGWELVLVLIAFMLVFGYKRLPDATRAIGKSMRILKAETKGLHDDGTSSGTTTTASAGDPSPTVTPVQPEHSPRSQP